ncbi:PTS sugar transporter subunit IIA domain-containing protein [Oceanivirga miroungae]|uniref:PTS system mannose/fructose/sorbose family transporter subunit IIA n=1 Tax=Oceanivirga miroungae TaxID=1130046 RepID=A0A6I8MBT4_9FUSO|nr:PTS mannose transporter subunit IIAB [Oceanivirga miroungae]VWL85662.1 PTS system mannose/fructose/sorbose family transporter subunit IIA [Oceanivirga miroungae]
MTSLLLTGHGKVSSGMYATLKMLFGVNDNIKFIDFLESDTAENLEVKIKNEIDELLKTSEAVLCLTDIKGGTPFKTCAQISIANSKVKVIAGTNIPMLMSLASEMEDEAIDELIEIALETGKSDIVSFSLDAIKAPAEDDDLDDGI